MFGNLKNKWKVSGGRLMLILFTFAVGGSLCGYAGRKLLAATGVEKGFLWVLLYIVLIVILWPVAVIAVSLITGQFPFFRNYLRRISRRMRGKHPFQSINIAIFASGAGTNAEKIIQTLPSYFKGEAIQPNITVIITDNPSAGVLDIANKNKIPTGILRLKGRNSAEISEAYLSLLKKYHVDFIVLAGYLKMIPAGVIRAFPKRIVNIHPALLPAYGGAGMYGNRVHEAVLAAGEKQSGISIHEVDDIYDNGKIVFQTTCDIEKNETPASLAGKIHALEHRYYSQVIAYILNGEIGK